MLNVYIVDDEKNIRESMKSYIPWEKLKVTNVYTAKNGIEALELMSENPPNILLSDIRMPKLDGIALATEVRKHYPQCIILFLSGYSDKEYLKSAIHLRAFQYVEKPLDMNVLISLLQNAIQEYDKTVQQEIITHQLSMYYEVSQPYIRQELIRTLYSSKGTKTQLQNLKTLDLQYFFVGHTYYVILMHIQWAPYISDGQIKKYQDHILEILNQNKWKTTLLSGFIDQSHCLLLTNDLESIGSNFLSEKSQLISSDRKDIVHAFLQELPTLVDSAFDLSVSISYEISTLSNCMNCVKQLKQLVNLKFYDQQRIHCQESNPIPTSPLKIHKQIGAALIESLITTNNQLLSTTLTQLKCTIRQSKETNLSKVESCYRNLYQECLNALEKEHLEVAMDILDKELKQLLPPGYFMTFENYHRNFEESYLKAMTMLMDYRKVGSRSSEIMQYIKQHYHENQLSINTIADVFALSPAYLCSSFKKSTNKTLNQYITDIRIEQAKEMLLHQTDKVYEIAIKVGFTDTNYFSSLFRKQVGVTPLEFKERGYK